MNKFKLLVFVFTYKEAYMTQTSNFYSLFKGNGHYGESGCKCKCKIYSSDKVFAHLKCIHVTVDMLYFRLQV